MKQFIVISVLLHIMLLVLMSLFSLTNIFKHPEIKQDHIVKVEFLDKLPINKAIKNPVYSKKAKNSPKKDNKKATPPPKPAPGRKTKATTSGTKKATETKKTLPIVKKAKTAPKKTPTKKLPTPASKQGANNNTPASSKKNEKGIKKEKQEVESVDALLNTLLPDVGGKPKETDAKLQEVSKNEMPENLENSAIQAIRSQIEAVWSYNPTEGINFYLTLKLDPTGKIVSVQLSGTNNQNTLQKAAAEAAYRATLKLERFQLDPSIFKTEYYKNGWKEIELHFHPYH